MDWLGQAEYMKTVYEQYENAICCLSRSLMEAGLRPVVMKGYGCSLNYPNPEMRPCGDIDIFLLDANGKCDFDKGNRIIQEKLQVEVDPHSAHHSTFQYNGFTVENHQTVLDVNSHKSSVYLNSLLEELALDYRIVNVKGQEVYIPSVKFNSIHLLRHMASDFATFTTSLRHVLDLGTFFVAHQEEIDWNRVLQVYKDESMIHFYEAIATICVRDLGMNEACFHGYTKNELLADRVLEDIFSQKKVLPMSTTSISGIDKLKYGIQKTARWWQNRWKYKMVYKESLWDSFITLATNRIKN